MQELLTIPLIVITVEQGLTIDLIPIGNVMRTRREVFTVELKTQGSMDHAGRHKIHVQLVPSPTLLIHRHSTSGNV